MPRLIAELGFLSVNLCPVLPTTSRSPAASPLLIKRTAGGGPYIRDTLVPPYISKLEGHQDDGRKP